MTDIRSFITFDDVRAFAQLPVGLAVAWLTPEPRLAGLAAASSRRDPAKAKAWIDKRRELYRALFGDRLTGEALEKAAAESNVHPRLLQLLLLRCHRPGGWRPPSELIGREFIDCALAEGRGALLWIAPFVHAALHAKVALTGAGLRFSHLSRYRHGRFTSRVGIRVLNGITRRAEDRFLDERIVIGPDEAVVAATRQLARRLRENRIVSIAANREGETVGVPFMNGSLVLANGAAKLELLTRAALLPVITVRTAEGMFRTVIEAPLQPEAEGTDRIRSLHAAYAARLEPYAVRYPEQLLISDVFPVIVVDDPTERV
jgi:hypothetical protein